MLDGDVLLVWKLMIIIQENKPYRRKSRGVVRDMIKCEILKKLLAIPKTNISYITNGGTSARLSGS